MNMVILIVVEVFYFEVIDRKGLLSVLGYGMGLGNGGGFIRVGCLFYFEFSEWSFMLLVRCG